MGGDRKAPSAMRKANQPFGHDWPRAPEEYPVSSYLPGLVSGEYILADIRSTEEKSILIVDPLKPAELSRKTGQE